MVYSFNLLCMRDFKQSVLAVVAKIPKGHVLSYKEIAKRAGNSGAARAVGNIMKQNRNPKVPCHRVIHSDGRIGGVNRGKEFKAVLLREEGVKLSHRLKVLRS